MDNPLKTISRKETWLGLIALWNVAAGIDMAYTVQFNKSASWENRWKTNEPLVAKIYDEATDLLGPVPGTATTAVPLITGLPGMIVGLAVGCFAPRS